MHFQFSGNVVCTRVYALCIQWQCRLHSCLGPAYSVAVCTRVYIVFLDGTVRLALTTLPAFGDVISALDNTQVTYLMVFLSSSIQFLALLRRPSNAACGGGGAGSYHSAAGGGGEGRKSQTQPSCLPRLSLTSSLKC